MARTIRCCIVHSNLHTGGAERQVVQLLAHWPDARWQFELVLLEHQGAWLSEVSVPTLGLSCARPCGLGRQLPWAAGLLPALRRQLARGGYDLVLTFLWLPTLLASIALGAGAAARPRLVWSVQSDLAAAFRLRRSGSLARPLVRYAASRVDRFIAVSPGTAQQIRTTLGVATERIDVVPNGVDLQRVAALAAAVPALPPAPAGRTRLVAVGRLHPQKGSDVLLRAVARLRAAGVDVECVLVGDGEERERLEALAHALGLGERAVFAGRVANPFAWLRTAHIFVLPSRWEPFGIALIEAMALGLPVVASATDGARAIVTHEVDGLLVPAGDVGALAAALSALARAHALRHALGERGRARAQHYDAALVAARYQRELEPLLQAPVAPRAQRGCS